MPSAATQVGPFGREVAAILRGWTARTQTPRPALSAAAGVSPSQLGRILAGERPLNVDQLFGMTRVLGVEATDVLSEARNHIAHGVTVADQETPEPQVWTEPGSGKAASLHTAADPAAGSAGFTLAAKAVVEETDRRGEDPTVGA